MKTIPMIFNQEMVKALVDGRKTVTRRPVAEWQLPVECNFKDERYPESKYMSTANNHKRYGFGVFGATPDAAMENYNDEYSSCAPYNKGDLIWVRETFQAYVTPEKDYLDADFKTGRGITISYPATDELVEIEDMETGSYSCRKRPSIHMPRWASRLTLRVTDVRCERVQKIDKEQAKKEGVSPGKLPWVKAYQKIWDSIYSNWDKNPWVWVVEFELIMKNVDELKGWEYPAAGALRVDDWFDLAKVGESDTHRLEIIPDDGNGWIVSKLTGEPEIYLSTHTFYGSEYKNSTKQLKNCGFNVQLANWDER